jgi:hypothetical protein
MNSAGGYRQLIVARAICGWRAVRRCLAVACALTRAGNREGSGRPVGARTWVDATIVGVALAALPATLSAQRVVAPVRTLLGDVAIILRPEVDGALAIGVAGPSRALTLTVRMSDARRWADSAARLAVPLPRAAAARSRAAAKGGGAAGPTGAPRRDTGASGGGTAGPNDSVRRARVVLEEPGVGAGSLVLSRADSAGMRSFLLFADDAELAPIRQSLTLSETRTLVRLMQRAAAPLPTRRSRR